MSDTVDLDDLFGSHGNHPLDWQGKHVWVRSLGQAGLVSGSSQNGKPREATITVSLLDRDGEWGRGSVKVTYTMERAVEDLVPHILYLIEELPV